MSWQARWFDGRTSMVHPATAALEQDELHIQPTGSCGESLLPIAVPIRDVLVSERFDAVVRKLQLPDGCTLEVEDDAEGGFDQALRANGHQPGVAAWLMQHRQGAIACLLVLVSLLVWMNRDGAGLLASKVVPFIPQSVDQRLGAIVGTLMEQNWMAPSQVPVERMGRLQARVHATIVAQHRDLVWQLAFRNMRNSNDAFNALTLPGGTIVLLDGLTGSLTDDQVIAVVAHELGHVVHRHTMQRLVRQVSLLALGSVVMGDVSGIAVAASAGYQELHYSRDAEREADAFAIEFLRRGHVPVRHLAEAFEVMRAQESAGNLPGFLSSHPPTEERLQLAREAQRGL